MMRSRGYIYTLLTIIMVMLILSLVVFYSRISKPRIEDIITNIRTDELYYLMNSMKEDYRKSSHISGQRAVVYAQNEVVDKRAGLDSYVFTPCLSSPPHVAVADGSQSAIAELMLCGTFEGAASGVMENNTLDLWLNRSRELASDLGFNMSMSVTDFSIRPFGAFKFLVLTNASVFTIDAVGNPSYSGGFVADAVVPIDGLADPLYYLQTGEAALVREFIPCNRTPLQSNASFLREWVDSECYLTGSSGYGSPSFFDRLDGNLTLSSVYAGQAGEVALELGDPRLEVIGLESIVNLNDWLYWYNVSVDRDASWVDYLHWGGVAGDCGVDLGGENYSGFRLDSAHVLKYYVDGAVCDVGVSYDGVAGHDVFNSSWLAVPLNATVNWSNRNEVENHTMLWTGGDDWCFGSGGTSLIGLGAYKECDFSGRNYSIYEYECVESGHGSISGTVYLSEPVMPANNITVCGYPYYCGINTDGVCIRDLGVGCSIDEDVDCSGVGVEHVFYADGGVVPKHRFSGIVRVGPTNPAPPGTPIRVNATSTGDYWFTSVRSDGSYSISVTFDDFSTAFDEGTNNGTRLRFYVSGVFARQIDALSGGVSNPFDLSVGASKCVTGNNCTVSGCINPSNSWYVFERNAGGGHNSCDGSSSYAGCVRDSGVGYFDQVCCGGIVTQIVI